MQFKITKTSEILGKCMSIIRFEVKHVISAQSGMLQGKL